MANMVMTILEAHIPEDQWRTVEEGFARMQSEKPPQLTQSYLVQSPTDPTLWQVVGLWRSKEALDEYRSSGVTPAGVLLLRSVGAEPTLRLFEVRS